MQINILVKAKANQEKVIKKDNVYCVWVKEPAHDNQANMALVSLLAKYFNCPKSQVIIKSGYKSKHKQVYILK